MDSKERIRLDEDNLLFKNILKKQAVDAEMISTLRSDIENNIVLLEIEQLKNETLKENLKRVTQEKICSDNKNIERINSLEEELKQLTLEKAKFELEKLAEIKKLTTDNKNLLEENSIFQLLITLGNEFEDTTCTICIDDMRLRKCTACRRRFHRSCIENWLEENNSCPTCRASME